MPKFSFARTGLSALRSRHISGLAGLRLNCKLWNVRYAVALSRQSVARPLDFVVVFHLVLRGAGSLFRSEPALMAHLAWLESDYRRGPLSEHHCRRGE